MPEIIVLDTHIWFWLVNQEFDYNVGWAGCLRLNYSCPQKSLPTVPLPLNFQRDLIDVCKRPFSQCC